MSACPICDTSIPSDRLMCRAHWYQCPRELRDDLWRAIHTHGWFSTEAGLARGECIRAVNQRQSTRTQDQLPLEGT